VKCESEVAQHDGTPAGAGKPKQMAMRNILVRLRADAGQLTWATLIQEREAAASEIERLRNQLELNVAVAAAPQPSQSKTARPPPVRASVEMSAFIRMPCCACQTSPLFLAYHDQRFTTGYRTVVHGRPRFARRLFRDGIKEQIAPVHPDFVCCLVPLSLMGLAGRLPIAFTHSRCYGRFGFGQPRSDLFAIIA
jgi:hypothetical protein